MEAHTFSRLVSFFIDIIVLSILLSLLTFWIPESKTYTEAKERDNEITNQFSKGEITSEQFFNEYFENSYVMEKERVGISIISVILSLGYFGTYAFYNNGQTLGKRLMRIKVVTDKDKSPSHISLIARALIINSVLASLLSCIIILFITKGQYVYTIGAIQVIQSIIMVISLFMVAFKKDKRGIHDIIAKTKVVQTN